MLLQLLLVFKNMFEMSPCSSIVLDAVALGEGRIVGDLMTAIEFTLLDGVYVSIAFLHIANSFPLRTINTNAC